MCTYFDSLATLCFTGLVCTCGSLAQPLCCRAYVFFRLPRPTLCTCGLCALERFVCHAFLGNLGMPSAPPGLCALERFVCCATQLPRPALCTARVVCAGEVCMLPLPRQPGLPSVLWGFYGLFSVPWARCLVGATVYVPFIGWELQLSVLCPLSPCFAQFSEISPLAHGPAYEGASWCMGNLPVSGLPPSPWAYAPVQKFSLFPFYVILSPTSYQRA